MRGWWLELLLLAATALACPYLENLNKHNAALDDTPIPVKVRNSLALGLHNLAPLLAHKDLLAVDQTKDKIEFEAAADAAASPFEAAYVLVKDYRGAFSEQRGEDRFWQALIGYRVSLGLKALINGDMDYARNLFGAVSTDLSKIEPKRQADRPVCSERTEATGSCSGPTNDTANQLETHVDTAVWEALEPAIRRYRALWA
mmetsp:Transcript_23084/g.53995  ORF Transcript_23084/g.53995 Transcript_23084/m.53995 type:complete len:201 (-) Transcript_23084:59-661(-)